MTALPNTIRQTSAICEGISFHRSWKSNRSGGKLSRDQQGRILSRWSISSWRRSACWLSGACCDQVFMCSLWHHNATVWPTLTSPGWDAQVAITVLGILIAGHGNADAAKAIIFRSGGVAF